MKRIAHYEIVKILQRSKKIKICNNAHQIEENSKLMQKK
jgi:hypothetical protein